jgi:hypothetical protein
MLEGSKDKIKSGRQCSVANKSCDPARCRPWFPAFDLGLWVFEGNVVSGLLLWERILPDLSFLTFPQPFSNETRVGEKTNKAKPRYLVM